MKMRTRQSGQRAVEDMVEAISTYLGIEPPTLGGNEQERKVAQLNYLVTSLLESHLDHVESTTNLVALNTEQHVRIMELETSLMELLNVNTHDVEVSEGVRSAQLSLLGKGTIAGGTITYTISEADLHQAVAKAIETWILLRLAAT
jgi:hypothetical protein